MPRRFNVAGPCKPELHYMLPAAARVPLARRLVADFNYFVIHAPRQTGKTTSMIALAQELTASGAYVAALVSVEVGAAFNHDPGAAELAILDDWRLALAAQLPP
ncbi:MAG: ATP-binding protein, partial [Chloroflexia bacterium]|nr:ATP-binding protein [Chloroflexia bacterium]